MAITARALESLLKQLAVAPVNAAVSEVPTLVAAQRVLVVGRRAAGARTVHVVAQRARDVRPPAVDDAHADRDRVLRDRLARREEALQLGSERLELATFRQDELKTKLKAAEEALAAETAAASFATASRTACSTGAASCAKVETGPREGRRVHSQ